MRSPDAASIKKANTLSILRAVNRLPMTTQPRLAAACGLTLPTVNKCVRELLERGAVRELAEAESSGGRPAARYVVAEDAGYILGVVIRMKDIVAGVFDFGLNVKAQVSAPFDLEKSGVEAGVQCVIALVSQLLSRPDLPHDKLLGMGVSVPGPVNYENGLIYKFPNAKKWRDVPLGQTLAGKFKLDVVVEKDNNANVLCWKWLEQTEPETSTVFLGMSDGVGAGILFQGEPYRGNRSVAGEVGHVSVDPKGPLCNCKNRGCLELYASEKALIRQASRRMARGAGSLIAELAGGGAVTIAHIIEAATRQDAFALSLLEDATPYVELCVDYVIKTYAPNELVIDSHWLKAFPQMFYRMIDHFFDSTELVGRDALRIHINKHDDLWLKAAAALVLDIQYTQHDRSVFVQ